MESSEHNALHSWEHLQGLVETGDMCQVESYLDALPIGEMVLAVSRLSDQERSHLLASLAPQNAAELIRQLPDVQAVDSLEELPANAAADIIEELPSDEQADLVGELHADAAEAILTEMGPVAAANVRTLVTYADDVAGGLMVREFLAFRRDLAVSDVIDDLRTHADRYRHFQVQYAYVIGERDELLGVLRLRDLLLEKPAAPMGELMVSNPLSVSAETPLNDLRDLFEKQQYFGVPVTDTDGRLLGVVRRVDVEEALADRSAGDYLKTQGIVREELRTMPVLVRSGRRLSWLTVNIGLNVVAASVIAFYQETLAQVVALAVFLPIISDMSGCSGNQAVAVSMRELSLGLVRPNEMFRVWLQEITVGLLNGLVLGMLLAAAAWLWKANPWLGVVVGTAMALNTMVAVSIGGTLPLLMRRMKIDPALASGPILTTVTDMCGFFLVLSLAASMISRLQA